MAPKTKSARRRMKFAIEAEGGSSVYVAGTFNGWDAKKNRLRMKDGVYSTTLLVARGRHEYKFIINDVWCVDPECREWVPNDKGSLNSVLTVD
jgi:1,4-alpha-glucan branching enzyme